MRDTFLADAQSVPLALRFGDAVQADELDNRTGDEYRATQRRSKLALERPRSYTDVPDEIAYDDLAGGGSYP